MVTWSASASQRQFAVVVTSFTMDEKAGDEGAHEASGELVDAIACK
jgi:hypothetical protein